MEGTGRDSSGAWVDVDKNGDDGNGEETTTMLPDQGGKPNTLVGEVIGKLGDIELANPENQGGTIQSSHDPKGGEQNLSSTAIVALIFLVLQNSMAVLIMRYTLVHPGEKEFLALTAVIMAEAFKTGVSLSILCLDGSFVEMFDDKIDVLKTSIPALIFLVQNNLQYIAVKNLHAATYQVLYQVKILTTAVVWVMVFRTPLGWKKWCALCFLLSGIVVIRESEMRSGPSKAANSQVNITIGLSATLAASITSALGGVYSETLMKGKSKLSVWQRNVLLGLYSTVLGLGAIACMPEQRHIVAEKGFFHGYTLVTCISISIQGGGGLIIGFVMKYATVILKDIATSLSIVFSCTFSALFFDQHLGAPFITGACMVVVAAWAFSMAKPPK
mmetsp:Transcript_36606/g.93269  ORF Transcript_36606/g.93269 Transcript_36606/m.93269 type:complete len:387 (+) Transcript_36606:49-1209(+)